MGDCSSQQRHFGPSGVSTLLLRLRRQGENVAIVTEGVVEKSNVTDDEDGVDNCDSS